MIYETDAWLAPYKDAVDARHRRILEEKEKLSEGYASLYDSINNHLYYGLHRREDGPMR